MSAVLLLDLGNTRLKWAWLHEILAARKNAGVFEPAALTHSGKAADWQALFRQNRPDRIVLASVAGALARELCDAIHSHWADVAVQQLVTPAQFGRWRCSYLQPEKLGVDRFVAMLGAQALAPPDSPCVIAVAGTALTIDVLAADGQHLGGLILPGPQLMRSSLRSATAQLPLVQLSEHQLGQSTEAAIAAGTTRAGASLITEVMAQYPMACSFLSGGAAPELLPAIGLPIQMRPDLLMQGLAYFCEQQFAN